MEKIGVDKAENESSKVCQQVVVVRQLDRLSQDKHRLHSKQNKIALHSTQFGWRGLKEMLALRNLTSDNNSSKWGVLG